MLINNNNSDDNSVETKMTKSKKKFKNEPNEVIVIKSQNQKYFVSVILNQQQKRKIETSKEHIFLTLQKTMECGRLSIYIIDVSEHSY